jgi:hypothetical protein
MILARIGKQDNSGSQRQLLSSIMTLDETFQLLTFIYF